MKVNNVTNWIVIDHQASSLFNVIEDRGFEKTAVGKDNWLSLIDGGELQDNCNKEGFNVESLGGHTHNPDGYIKVRIGIIANNRDHCYSCDSCIGFGTSAIGCKFDNIRVRNTTCGNIGICGYIHNMNTAAFGYILVK